MAFTPRLTSDGMQGSKYYYTDNPFYNAGLGPQQTGGNCTWYAFGRFYEIRDKYPSGLSTGNANVWYNGTTGFDKGTIPKLGAIACYQYYNQNSGHVCVVEQITTDGIITSNSGYSNGEYFWTEKEYVSNNYVPSWCNGFLQGFIYTDVDTGESDIPSTLHWQSLQTYPDEYLNEKSINNAYCVDTYLLNEGGWTLEAICAMLGNMMMESFISADMSQNLVESDTGGYGLIMWTPSGTTVKAFLNENYPTWYSDIDVNGNGQCQYLCNERDNNPSTWSIAGVSSEYQTYQTFQEFAQATGDVAHMADCFLYCRERPYNPEATKYAREYYAEYFYNLLKGYNPSGNTGYGLNRKGMPVWMYPMFGKRLRRRS